MDNHIAVTPGFCPNCGSILPQLKMAGGLVCYVCEKSYSATVFGKMDVEYTIHFNSVKTSMKDSNENAEEGPVVDRICGKCGNNKMSYATLQLRSVDEGQTVFFTCTKCKNKETENS